MQTVDSLERDYVFALTNIFKNIPQDEYHRPVQLGEVYTLSEEKGLVFRPLILVERRAVSYRNTLRCLDPKTITEAGIKDLSLRRIENIFKVEANRNTNQELLTGVDLQISPSLKALEALYDFLKPIASDASGLEPEQVAPIGAAEAEVVSEGKPVIKVPTALFVGKAPQAACEALRTDGYSDEVIAFILVEKLSIAKDATGKLLEPGPTSADKIKKFNEKDPKTYRSATNNLLEKAKNYCILTV